MVVEQSDRLCVRPNEAARMASISRSTIYASITDGSLPSFKRGTSRLIWVRDLVSWLES